MARQQTAPGAVGVMSVRKGSRGWRGRARVRDWSGEVEEAGFPWAHSHTFRKTVATKLDKAGLAAREIANHLGHSDIGSTMIYMDRRQGSPRAATAL